MWRRAARACHPVLAPLDQQHLGFLDDLGAVRRAGGKERDLPVVGDLSIAEIRPSSDDVADLVEIVAMTGR